MWDEEAELVRGRMEAGGSEEMSSVGGGSWGGSVAAADGIAKGGGGAGEAPKVDASGRGWEPLLNQLVRRAREESVGTARGGRRGVGMGVESAWRSAAGGGGWDGAGIREGVGAGVGMNLGAEEVGKVGVDSTVGVMSSVSGSGSTSREKRVGSASALWREVGGRLGLGDGGGPPFLNHVDLASSLESREGPISL